MDLTLSAGWLNKIYVLASVYRKQLRHSRRETDTDELVRSEVTLLIVIVNSALVRDSRRVMLYDSNRQIDSRSRPAD
jgi:hypothetical protein